MSPHDKRTTIRRNSKSDAADDVFNSTVSGVATSTAATSFTDLRATKMLYGIRHGLSLSNEWMAQPGNAWGSSTFQDNVKLRDSPLSAAGVQQAQALRVDLSDIELIVVSPLTRCLQTYQYGIAPVNHGGIPVLALPLMTERVYTISETGRPATEIANEFPDIDWSLLMETQHPWWYHPEAPTNFNSDIEWQEWRPSSQGQQYAVPGEPHVVFERRMDALKQWFMNRQEKKVLAVAHWGVFRHFTGEEMTNCQALAIPLE